MGRRAGPNYSLATQSRAEFTVELLGCRRRGAAERNRRCFLNNREKSREWM